MVMRDYTITYRDHQIQIKQDFGGKFFLIDGMPCMWGYVVTRNGLNVMPGATWFQTVKDAKRAIDVLFEVGGEKNYKEFWALLREDGRVRDEAAAFFFACMGPRPHSEPEVSPLSYLHALLEDLRLRGPGEDNDDPDAYDCALNEGRRLYVHLMNAVLRVKELPQITSHFPV